MLLSTWIHKSGGTLEVGKLLGVGRGCVYAWKEGRCLPRAQVMKSIVEKSRGRVSYEEMVVEYIEKKKNRKKKPSQKNNIAKRAANLGKLLKQAKKKKPTKVDLGF